MADAASAEHSPLLILISQDPYHQYYEEIIRTEGLNAYEVKSIHAVDANTLRNYDVIILPEMPLQTTQVAMLTDWVKNGGNLIAMRPDKQFAELLGVKFTGTTLADKYLLIHTNTPPGKGLVNETIQYHGIADGYEINDAVPLATLYDDATTSTKYPAVILRKIGDKGGQVAAFAFDLAKSVIMTRQGNKAWAGQSRTGYFPIRAIELFYPDFLDMNKVAIPQADEQQRLLANLIILMNMNHKPLPKFWYLPNGKKAVILHALDDHDTPRATKLTFNKLKANSPPNGTVRDWEAYRATAWVYSEIPVTDKEALAYHAEGFEIGVHVNTGCVDRIPNSLDTFFKKDLDKFHAKFPSLPRQRTHRLHCVIWDDWSTLPKTELKYGIRFDTNYYYWPPKWVKNRPGLFTGSGIPMRFTDVNGSIIDVYQAPTQISMESGIKFPFIINELLDKALGPEGYYGVFTTHDDLIVPSLLDHVIESARSHGVSIVSAEQVLTWLDAKNSSYFHSFRWNNQTLSFSIHKDPKAHNLQVLIPENTPQGKVEQITHAGVPVSYTLETLKGISYATFLAIDGEFKVSYKGKP